MIRLTDQQPSRVSIDRQEFEAFLAENRELVERFESLLKKIDSLEKLNKSLEESMRSAEGRVNLPEQRANVDLQQADETLRNSRAIMARLLEETDKRLTGEKNRSN